MMRALPRIGSLQRSVIDIMALTGDAVDNVPGVPGIGKKTASRLINHFGTLDTCLLYALIGEGHDPVMSPRIRALLLEHLNAALLSRKLVMLTPIDG